MARSGVVAVLAGALLVAAGAAAQEPATTPADGRPLLDGALPPVSIEFGSLGRVEVEEDAGPDETPAVESVPPATVEGPSFGLVAAAWCAMRSGPAEPVAEGEEGPPGCDFGVGASLWGRQVPGRGWLSVVAAIGAESFAVGVAWTVLVMQHPVSVGLGLMIPHGGGAGIDLDLVAPAVGANFGLQGGS